MNILFVDQFGYVGGGQRSLLDLLPGIRARCWNARVALPAGGPFAGQVRAAGFETDFVPCSAYSPARKTITDVGRYLCEVRPMVRALSGVVATHRIDLLYVNGPRLLPAAAWVAHSESIPLIFHCHHRLLQPWAVRLAGQALRWSRALVIACCRFAGEPLSAYTSGRYRVVYNGVQQPSWKRRVRDPVKSWNIGVIGRVEPEKGQLEFVSAARMLSAEFSNCRFLVAGAPLFSGPEYFHRVKEASLDLPVEFLGWQNDIAGTFSQLDILAVPSSEIDSTPRVLIEAFAGGLPVVAFPAGGIPEVIRDGVTGFLAARRTASALASRIQSVLTMGLRPVREVCDQAKAAWREKYTLERFQEEVGQAISDAAG